MTAKILTFEKNAVLPHFPSNEQLRPDGQNHLDRVLIQIFWIFFRFCSHFLFSRVSNADETTRFFSVLHFKAVLQGRPRRRGARFVTTTCKITHRETKNRTVFNIQRENKNERRQQRPTTAQNNELHDVVFCMFVRFNCRH